MARRTTRGAVAMFAARIANNAIMLVSSAIVARILGPDAYGLVAMVTAIMAIAAVLEDFGLGDAAVQREGVTAEQQSALFWINAALGLAVSAAFAACAPLMASFYGRPEIVPIALALSPTFLLAALGGQHRAIARRRFMFRQIATNRVLGAVASAVATTAAALGGLGLWALVIGRLVGAVSGLVHSWRITGWIPGAPRRTEGLGELLGFGGSLVGTQIANTLVRYMDNIAIGRAIGAAGVGVYDRAFNLMALPQTQLNQPLSHSMVPVLARLQSDPEGFRKLYHGGCQMAAAVTFPTSIFLLVAAPAAVGTMYGPKWNESVVVLQALSLGGIFISLNVTIGWVYMSLGRSRRQIVWNLFSSALLIGAIFAGLPHGVLGVAVCLSAMRAALWIPSLLICYRGTFLRLGETIEAMWRPMVASLAAGAAAWFADPTAWSAPTRLCAQAAVFGVAGFGALCVLPGGLALIAQVRSLRRHLAAPAKRKRPAAVDAATES
jgi:PST family polysaccharide transporter